MRDLGDEDELEVEAAVGLDAQRTMARLRALLSQAELEALLLSSVERLAEREIAQVVRRSERAVHSLLHRAREKAREVLGADDIRERG